MRIINHGHGSTIDGSVDIHENRDNVSEVNNLEHGRTYGFSTVLARNSNLAFTLGYNYTDISLQTFICFRDNFGASRAPHTRAFHQLPDTYSIRQLIQRAPLPPRKRLAPERIQASIWAQLAFYTSRQHYAYSDVMWKPVKRVTTSLGYTATFVGGSTVFLNPLQPAGTLAFNYQKPFVSIQIDIYKGLSYKTTWNYYAIQLQSTDQSQCYRPQLGAGLTQVRLTRFNRSRRRTSTAAP